MFASLRAHPRFALLWVSNLFFFGGVWSLTLVLGWLAFELTGSEMLVALYTAARLAPLLLGPLAGALADRHDRVRLLLLAAGWAAAATFLLAALAGAGLLPYWALVVGGFVLGLAQSPSQPARASRVLDIVGHENLSNANALNALAMNMTQVFGPALGGVLIGSLGPSAALWVSGAWFVVSFALLVPLRGIATARSGHGSRADRDDGRGRLPRGACRADGGCRARRHGRREPAAVADLPVVHAGVRRAPVRPRRRRPGVAADLLGRRRPHRRARDREARRLPLQGRCSHSCTTSRPASC